MPPFAERFMPCSLFRDGYRLSKPAISNDTDSKEPAGKYRTDAFSDTRAKNRLPVAAATFRKIAAGIPAFPGHFACQLQTACMKPQGSGQAVKMPVAARTSAPKRPYQPPEGGANPAVRSKNSLDMHAVFPCRHDKNLFRCRRSLPRPLTVSAF